MSRISRAHRVVQVVTVGAVTVVTAFAGTGVASARPKPPASPPPPAYKALTYVVWGGTAGYDLYTMDGDGNGQTVLPKASKNTDTVTTNSPATEWAPYYSPDGGLIAYQSSRGGDPDVWVQDTVTGAMTRVTSSRDREAPSGWYRDPGGQLRILYGSGSQMFSVKPDGSGAFPVTPSVPGMQRAAVSTDGKVAVPADLGDGVVRIYTFSINASAPVGPSAWTQATSPPAHASDVTPSWTPDGGLLFGRGNSIMRLAPGQIESSTTAATTVLTDTAGVGNPAYRASTQQLAYDVDTTSTSTSFPCQIAITTVNADWTAAPGVVVTHDSGGQDSQPTWKN